MQIIPHNDSDTPTHHGDKRQRPDLPAERWFRPGHVYSRRTCEGPRLRLVEQLQGSMQAVRFRPGLVYSWRRARGPSTSSLRRGCATIKLQQQRLVMSATESEVHEAENNGDTATPPMTTFVAEISQPLTQPFLQDHHVEPAHCSDARRPWLLHVGACALQPGTGLGATLRRRPTKSS